MSFDFYEGHVQSCLEEARNLINSSQIKDNPRNIELARTKLDNAKSASEELQREIFLLPTNDRASAQRRYQQLKEQIASIEDSFQSLINRQQLLGNNYDLHKAASVDYSLSKAAQYGEESIEIGKGVLSNLSQQREKLLHGMENVDAIRNSVHNSSSIVNGMHAIQRQNKMIMWGIVVLLVLAILLILYMKVF
ncbi:Vesicle transport v-SNARE protein [Histomonas meleagridis]|uniref:Vesicle transport v-SNARE protein n=1 Tax=Histomonas meleagridis TaxID=135588 RepID=UPI003559407A|nr:Vesicle transport v-SNARE protein [Histomonas meleagridis]KAH0804469.1 Vesicle transport v-SNARE protein [Histomonas meleagridis]